MKKFLIFCSVILCIAIVLNIVYYHKKTKMQQTLTEINASYDSYNNLIKQVLYNEHTSEYFITEYSYIYKNSKWICVDQKTTVIDCYPKQNDCTLKTYYNHELTYGPIVLLSNADIKISIVKYLAKDKWWEFGYELKVENKSNRTLSYIISDPSIMNIECEPLFDVDHIEAGHSAYFIMAWDRETLERSYIPYIDNIKFKIRIYDTTDWRGPAISGTEVLIKQ